MSINIRRNSQNSLFAKCVLLFILIIPTLALATTSQNIDKEKNSHPQKSANQVKVEKMLDGDNSGCGKKFEENEFKQMLGSIPLEYRRLEEIMNNPKKSQYNLFDVRTGEFVMGVTDHHGPFCTRISFYGRPFKKLKQAESLNKK